MGTNSEDLDSDESEGLIPRTIKYFFKIINENKLEIILHCSYIELYKENIKDLLHPDTPSSNITIQNDSNGTPVVTGISKYHITNLNMILELLQYGNMQRQCADNFVHNNSSRSHAIFTLHLTINSKDSIPLVLNRYISIIQI